MKAARKIGSVMGVACKYKRFGFIQNSGAGERSGGGSGDAPYRREQESARQYETGRRWNRARQTVAPPRIVLYKKHRQRDGQRQPRRPDLVVAGSPGIQHAARDVEVRLRVAI